MTATNPKTPTASGISRLLSGAGIEPPVRCALCLRGLGRWYLGSRAPFCCRCWDRGKSAEGPVQNPWLWELKADRVSPAAREVWESWVAYELTVTAGKEG